MRRMRYIGIGTIGIGAALAGACIDPESPLITEASDGCNEFEPGEDLSGLDLHPKAQAYVQAASDFTGAASEIANEVLTACANIATDLGAEDTWSQIDNIDDAISNSERTGACDAAGARVEEILIEAERVDANLAIAVSRGECHPDFEEQARCDAQCVADAECDSGTVVTRCEPGSLSVVCEGSCEASATCVGTLERPANCMGKCQAECVGQCQGTCIGQDGRVTENDPNCVGKCASACNGTCKGQCEIAAPEGIQCGANVRCTGGCEGEIKEPVCTSEFKPPECTVDPDCYTACSAQVIANAPCDPTQVDIFVDVEATPDVRALVETLEENLGTLIDAAEDDGRFLLDAAGRLGDSGKAIREKVDDLDGKSVACLVEASGAVGESFGPLDASVNASVDVTIKTTDRMH